MSTADDPTTADSTTAAPAMPLGADRSGYDPGFLTVDVPLPAVRGTVRELPYVHFTVLLDPERRLAALTAVNIDGSSLVDLGRGDDWHLDERVPESEQTGPAVYASNDLDRGHLVRRRDPVWGDAGVAAQANVDTFSYTNAAPQAAEFNQSKELWLGLEDQVLAYASTNRRRLTVFTAPVLLDDDAPYRGIRLPRRFFKIAAWTTSDGPSLRTAGYLLDQSPELDGVDLEAAFARAHEVGDPPPLGPFRTYQVPVRDIAEMTGLDLGQLAAADSLRPVPTIEPPDGIRDGWVPLTSVDQLTF